MCCKYYTIAKSQHGSVLASRTVSDKITFMFGNICQVLTLSQYLKLGNFIKNMDAEHFFHNKCSHEVMYVCTESSHLFFAFTKAEILELKQLIQQAHLIVAALHQVQTSLN
ncbi:MAG TPA: DUF6686 family protein [Cytophagales bacterium]|nr:DUF6686 family protein [Cytophagales bacterium]